MKSLVKLALVAIGLIALVGFRSDRAYGGDPDLEPGFPVQTYDTGGTYGSGFAINTLVGNIDADPKLEIVVSAIANGPLYAFHSDGSPVSGWPSSELGGMGYAGMGELNTTKPGYEVFAGYYGGYLEAVDGSNTLLPNWEFHTVNYVTESPMLVDMDNNGLDEMFIDAHGSTLLGYYADGNAIQGTFSGPTGREFHTPSAADLDGDGEVEILATTSLGSEGVYLHAFHTDGNEMEGFPVSLHAGVFSAVVVGDVDKDGALEIVNSAIFVDSMECGNGAAVDIRSADGTLERTIRGIGCSSYGTAPALADLDGDTFPEIILQTDSGLNAWYGDGTPVANFPIRFRTGSAFNSSAVIGDVDGDLQPDIVVTHSQQYNKAQAFVFDHCGVIHPRFPKSLLLGSSAVPAIADIDLDGRNEIIITGNYWDGFSGSHDKVWAYDLGGSNHGRIEWGQFGGGPKHQGLYVPATTAAPTSPCAELPPQCVGKPWTFNLLKPDNQGIVSKPKVTLKWEKADCATSYKVMVKTGNEIVAQKTFYGTKFKTPPLASGKTYYWTVKACSARGCRTSAVKEFTIVAP